MRKKLWEWGAQIRKHSSCAINAQSGTSLQIDPPPPSPYNVGNGNSRKFPVHPTTEQSLHKCKLHMRKKLWEWGAKKRKPSVCAINAQSGIRACKLIRLHHRRIKQAMELRSNSRQTILQKNSCTNANYI